MHVQTKIMFCPKTNAGRAEKKIDFCTIWLYCCRHPPVGCSITQLSEFCASWWKRKKIGFVYSPIKSFSWSWGTQNSKRIVLYYGLQEDIGRSTIKLFVNPVFLSELGRNTIWFRPWAPLTVVSRQYCLCWPKAVLSDLPELSPPMQKDVKGKVQLTTKIFS